MDPEKILLFTMSGLSFFILFVLFILFLLERKKIKEKITEETTRLEKIINEHSKQTVILMDGLKNELKKLRLEFIEGIEQENIKINSINNLCSESFEGLNSGIKNLENKVSNNTSSIINLCSENFEGLNSGIKNLENKISDNTRNFKMEFDSYKDATDEHFDQLEYEINEKLREINLKFENLKLEVKDSYLELDSKLSKIYKLLNEPIDIEEWINESER